MKERPAVGTIVVLRGSLEPVMVVSGWDDDDDKKVFCRWFDKAHHMQREKIPVAVLDIATLATQQPPYR
jgi:hypothetical protein